MLSATYHGFGFWWAFPLVFMGLLLLPLLWVGRRHPPLPPMQHPGLGVLEERYAKGEIDRDEFLARRADLLSAH